MRELTARLFALPRELRDLVYEYIWETKPSATFNLIKLVLVEQGNDGRVQPPPACSDTLRRLPSCKCLSTAPSFLDPGLMGERIISELLEAYHREVKTWGISDRESYRVHWRNMEAFAARDLFHLGTTLHGLLKHFRLEISIDCLDASQHRSARTRRGPVCTNNRLARFVDALNLLCQEEPRPVTFAFKDKEKKTPSHMEYVFRALSGPFRKLKERGFDPRVTYTSPGFGMWDLSSDGWETICSDVWKWTAYDWRIKFIRCNEWFQPRTFMGDSFHPNPNGPVDDKHFCDFRFKVPVWEGIRKYLYVAIPELEQADAVQFRRGPGREWYIDCGCVEGKHTCSPYYQCFEHGGWDGYGWTGLNTYCYTCAGLGPPTEY